MSAPREQAELDSVYWMESSKRRQALEWLAREDLKADERRDLERFVARFRTAVNLSGRERRSLLGAYARIQRRLTRRGHPPRRS